MSPIIGIIASATTANPIDAFDSIASVAGTGSSNTVTFSNIPSGYKSLQIRFIGKSTQTGAAARYTMTVRANGDTGSNYQTHVYYSTGTTPAGASGTSGTSISSNQAFIPNSGTGMTSIFGCGIIDVQNYLSTSYNKTFKSLFTLDANGTVTGLASLNSGLWTATPAAITSISLIIPTGSWTTSSSFALYGIK